MSLSDTALITVNQAKSYMRVAPATEYRVPGEFIGVGDGADTTWSLDNTPVSGSLQLYVNNVLQVETTNYSISGADITFVVAPPLNQGITASYYTAATDNTFEAFDDDLIEWLINGATKKAEDYCGRAFIHRSITEYHYGDGTRTLRLYKSPVSTITSVSYKRVVGKTGDGATTEYALGYTPKTSSLTVYVDGTLKSTPGDYSLAGSTVTFVAAPADATKIVFRFEVSLDLVDDYMEQLRIGRLTGSWVEGYEYVIVYTGGYGATRAATQALIPEAVSAVMETVANWYDNRLGVSAENVAGIGSVNYVGGDALGGQSIGNLPGTAMQKLSHLRRDLI